MEINSTKIALPNPHLRTLKRDYLYHFGLTTNDNFTQRFKDVKVRSSESFLSSHYRLLNLLAAGAIV